VPSADQSQIHVMNALRCPVSVSIMASNNGSAFEPVSAAINASSDYFAYDLKPDDYFLSVAANCSDGSFDEPLSMEIRLQSDQVFKSFEHIK